MINTLLVISRSYLSNCSSLTLV